jgi:hypothetical protein
MKRVLIASLVILLVVPSCKFIKTKILSKNKVDTLSSVIDTMSQAEQVDSSILQDMAAQAQQETQAPADVVENRTVPSSNAGYYMIVGCFMVPENASKYAEKIRSMGYEGEIISGNGGFQMVTARSYDNYRASIAEIDQLRSAITPNAWVYVRK